MIYTHEDKHPVVSALKKKGWILFEVYGNRVTEKNGIHGGWWIDCAVAYETDHYETHKTINGKYLGNTLRDSLRELKSDRFPSNINHYSVFPLDLIQSSVFHFDIDRDDLYEYGKPKDRTRNRLKEIAELGMKEVGCAQFGYEKLMSGLYLEMVWSYSDEDFKSYMDWVKSLIFDHHKK